MNKLKLEIDALEVTSFDTDDRVQGRGTVLGASIVPASEQPPCLIETEITGPCCDYTLALSCVQTNCEECTAGPA